MATTDWPNTARPKDGVGIRYEERGKGEPTIVFLHAWSCDREYWAYQIPPFGRARHVVAIDLAGHGESEGHRTTWTIEQLGEDVAVVCDDAELERVVLVGHSLGAAVALEAARRLGPRCEAIVAVNAFHDVGAPPTEAQIEGFLAPLRTDYKAAVDGFVRQGAFLPDSPKDLVDLVATRMSDRPPEIAIPLFEAYLRYDAAQALEQITCPVHCIQSEQRSTNVDAARKHHARFDAVTIPGVGQFPMLEDAKTFNTLLGQYLAQL